jgi:hypothetical protein
MGIEYSKITHFVTSPIFFSHMLLSPIHFSRKLGLANPHTDLFIYLFPPSPRHTLGAGSFLVCPSVDKPVVPGPLPGGSQAVLAYHALWHGQKHQQEEEGEEEEASSQGGGHALAQQRRAKNHQQQQQSSKQVTVDLCTA